MDIFISWVDAIVAGVLITLVIYLIYRNFRARVLFRELSELYMQALADKALMENKVKELYQEIENTKLESSDGFLKFLSDSRDWAFQYIEEVQNALEEFDKEIAPRLEWARTFGSVTGDTVHTNTIQTISEAYEKLKKVLPKNTETPNN